jgi:hypothetical protein
MLCAVCLSLRGVLLQYASAVCKRVEEEGLRQRLRAARVRQTEVLMVLLHTFCSGAALLLPCIVIHLTQVMFSFFILLFVYFMITC